MNNLIQKFKNLKFHWKLGLAINIPIFLIFLIAPFLSSYLFEKSILEEAINVRLKKNFDFAYLSLMKGHENMPINVYKIFKQELLEKFPGIKVYPAESLSSFYGLKPVEIKDNKLKNAFNSNKEIIEFDTKKESIKGYFPIKAESSCLVCHSNVSQGDILGVISISIPLSTTFKSIFTTKLILFAMGLLGIFIVSFTLFIVYMKVGHAPIMKIASYLTLLSEGDLSFKIDKDLLEQKDIIGDLAKNLKKLKDYLNNFNSKILDFSLKLTKQVDNVFKTVDSANKNIKAVNLNINEIELYIESLYRVVNEISRKTIQINTLLRVLANLGEKSNETNKIDWKNINETINNLNTETIELIEKIEKVVKDEEKIANSFEEISNLFHNLNKILDQINSYVYENLIISTYMKNLASTVKLEEMEQIVFDLFETDLERYILRIESHIKGIESLEPTRWGDPKALSLGKWLETEEYLEFKNQIEDFDFANFENVYKELFALAKEIIQAYNREDYMTVDKNLENLRKTYVKFKDSLEELKHLYLEFLETKASKGGEV